MGLRWRERGERRAHARQFSGCGDEGIGSSRDDNRVTGQAPRPGTRVRRGTVVVLDTRCLVAPSANAGCA
jgi:hypothetical protein